NDRPIVARQPSGGPLLIAPGEAVFRVLRKLHVVRWIGVDEVSGAERKCLDVSARECPARQGVAIWREVARVADSRVPSERHIEKTAAVESAQAVESGPIEIVEKRGGFLRRPVTGREKT